MGHKVENISRRFNFGKSEIYLYREFPDAKWNYSIGYKKEGTSFWLGGNGSTPLRTMKNLRLRISERLTDKFFTAEGQ